jgi:hypothetical protein
LILDPSKQDYDDLKRMALKLHMPVTEMFWKFDVHEGGKLVHSHEERGHSWVRNAYNWLASDLMGVNGADSTFGAGKINMKSTAGVVQSGATIIYPNNTNVEATGAGYVGYAGLAAGLVVGTSNTAFGFEQYSLQSLIAHGSGSGQLSYNDGAAPNKSYDAGTKTYTVQHVRVLNNNSPGSIVVAEAGLYFITVFNIQAMMVRDVLVSPVTVNTPGQLTVTYTISLTFPA